MNKILLHFVLFTIISSGISAQEIGILHHYNFNNKNKRVVQLPGELNEISGLAYFGSTRLIAHNDEHGIIFFIDVNSGKTEKKVRIGKSIIKRDFEGIAKLDNSVFIMTSEGELYSLITKNQNQFKIDKVIKINNSGKLNFEGLCYDPVTKKLLLVNKVGLTKSQNNERGIFSFDPVSGKFSDKPIINISLIDLKKRFRLRDFSPTAIEVHPLNKNFIILSSDEKCIIEISRAGKILDVVKLNGKEHRQPEGLTFLEDYTMIISDEAAGSKAKLTIIPFEK